MPYNKVAQHTSQLSDSDYKRLFNQKSCKVINQKMTQCSIGKGKNNNSEIIYLYYTK